MCSTQDEVPFFTRVTDFCSSGLSFDSRAWGPRLEESSCATECCRQDKDIKLDVYEKMGMVKSAPIRSITNAYAPGSKWEPAVTTSYEPRLTHAYIHMLTPRAILEDWFQWSQIAYPPNADFFRVLGSFEKEGASISRADMESGSARILRGL